MAEPKLWFFSLGLFQLEDQLSPHLHLSCVVIGAVDLAERFRVSAHVGVGGTRDAMIEQIECLSSEFESPSLTPERELPED